MPIKILPSVDYLRECFDYNPDTGVISWQTRPRQHFNSDNAYAHHYARFAGQVIDHIDPKGYLNLTLDGVHYRAARVIWKLVTLDEPPGIIDHIDRDKLNNRWSNLRAATSSQSIRNRTFKSNASGYRGVYANGDKWKASIYRDGRLCYLGRFETAKEAAVAYETAARELHGEFYYKKFG